MRINRRFPLLILAVLLLTNTSFLNSQIFSNPVVTKLAEGFQFVEGPVWMEGTGLLFSDIPSSMVYKWTDNNGISVYYEPSGNSNGLAVDAEGRLVLAQHGPRQVSRLEENKTLTPLATHYKGKRLNSPNDLAIHSDGSVFFTDPPYGLNDQGGTPELTYNGVFRVSPAGDVQLLDSTVNTPNGIAFSPDETRLYVTDSEARIIYVYDVVDDTTISGRTQFAYMQPFGYADGLKTDEQGFVYASGPIGIWIYSPDGTVLDTIAIPGQTSNCAWGGEDGKTLYVTSGSALYKITNSEGPDAVPGIKPEALLLSPFPNPFRQEIIIPYFSKTGERITISIYDSSGKLIKGIDSPTSLVGMNSITWNSEGKGRGVYFIQAGNSDQICNQDIVIIKI
jgi:sugar lactone lactonase YvrE